MAGGDEQRVVYVAGPYTARTVWGVAWNIWRAWAAARRLARLGFAPLCPHANSAFMPADLDWYGIDLEFLRRLRPGHDAIFMLTGWEASRGAVAELAEARRLGLLIWFDGAEIYLEPHPTFA